jgi:hypothetical protein
LFNPQTPTNQSVKSHVGTHTSYNPGTPTANVLENNPPDIKAATSESMSEYVTSEPAVNGNFLNITLRICLS